jgi:serine/threonine protein kinase
LNLTGCFTLALRETRAPQSVDNALYTEPTQVENYITGVTYRIAPFTIDREKTEIGGGNFSDIRYRLDGAPDSWFVNVESGEILGSYATSGYYAFELVATNKDNTAQTVERYNFSVRDPAEFIVKTTLNRLSVGNPDFTDYDNSATRYYVGESYRIARLELDYSEGGTRTSDGSPINEISYTLGDSNATAGWFISVSSGEIFGQFKDVGVFTLILMAVDGAKKQGVVQQYTFNVEALPEPEVDSLAANGNKNINSAVVGGISGAFIVLALVGIAIFRWYDQRARMKPFDFQSEILRMHESGEFGFSADHDQIHDGEAHLGVPREIKRSHLHMIEEVGKGQFGSVYKATLDESSTVGGVPEYLVAAKTVLDAKESPDATRELRLEAMTMAELGSHPNIVSIIGVITRGDPLVLIVSFCEHGSLLSLLRCRADSGQPLNGRTKIQMACDVANGMSHLEAHQFVHRDLAARNVLVSSSMVGKVADFGLSRQTQVADGTGEGDYYKSQAGIFPIRWTAPEAMEELKFTSQSDIWSFAIVMVEIFQDGGAPYGTTSLKNSEIMSSVMQGSLVHVQPPSMGPRIYKLLVRCWSRNPAERPGFVEIAQILHLFVQAESTMHSDPDSETPAEYIEVDETAVDFYLNGGPPSLPLGKECQTTKLSQTLLPGNKVEGYHMPIISGNPQQHQIKRSVTPAVAAETADGYLAAVLPATVLPTTAGKLKARIGCRGITGLEAAAYHNPSAQTRTTESETTRPEAFFPVTPTTMVNRNANDSANLGRVTTARAQVEESQMSHPRGAQPQANRGERRQPPPTSKIPPMLSPTTTPSPAIKLIATNTLPKSWPMAQQLSQGASRTSSTLPRSNPTFQPTVPMLHQKARPTEMQRLQLSDVVATGCHNSKPTTCIWMMPNSRACKSPFLKGKLYCKAHSCLKPGCRAGCTEREKGCPEHSATGAGRKSEGKVFGDDIARCNKCHCKLTVCVCNEVQANKRASSSANSHSKSKVATARPTKTSSNSAANSAMPL